MTLRKTLTEDIAQIETLIDDQTKDFKKAVREYLRNLKSDESAQIIKSYLEQGRTDLVLQYINEESNYFDNFFLIAFVAAAAVEIKLLLPSVKSNSDKQGVSFSFDPTSANALNSLVRIQSQFKQHMNTTNTMLISAIVSDRSFTTYDRSSVSSQTNYFLQMLGLNEKQYKAVNNYRTLLENLSSEALQRTLRNTDYDAEILNAIKNNKALTKTQIDKMVNSYKSRLIQSRINTLSRTMSKQIVEAARAEAANQLYEAYNIPANTQVKEWRSQRDDKVRRTHTHASLDGQVVLERDSFTSISGARLRYPGDAQAPLSETANCRCFLLRYVQKIEDR